MRRLVLLLFAGVLAACGAPSESDATSAQPPPGAFHSGECNLVTDDEVEAAAGTAIFRKVLDGSAGCFWQEDTMLGSVGAGMGISTWWYRGSDLDLERQLEHDAGRTITELEMSGNQGFQAQDVNACSIYIDKGDDVIAWSIQTLNPASLPDLCSITAKLAQLSQDRVN
ncbi:DUF3558 domain-containing protein [Mycolicibacterium mengxianglii]|uniref:DUF3558 domain-containing protein n=1 Tax=Mycolicibacterium mengxianglii TaxID=2736649 RepID=UPI0018D0A453|nr:DUF3558 domain-containing protein [Mycolicibacterium mengxianglii]